MEALKTQRGSCRFKAIQGADGKPVIQVELFHQTVPFLADTTIEFELLSGTTLEQARKVAESANERILGVIVSKP